MAVQGRQGDEVREVPKSGFGLLGFVSKRGWKQPESHFQEVQAFQGTEMHRKRTGVVLSFI